MKIRQVVMTVGALAAFSTVLRAQAPLPACSAGTAQSFGANGAVQSYTIPPGATSLVIVANGASGGAGRLASAPGTGAHVAALVPAPSALMLNVIVGVAGDSSGNAGGGGGGSFVYTPSDTLLVAAGGGGGAGFSANGNDAQLGQNGGDAVGPYGGAGGTAGSGGFGGTHIDGANGGGGGGFLSAGTDGADGLSGAGGHRISSPGDAAGGAGWNANGGFGGGGGNGQAGGGGGGGYSGGGGAYGEDVDGGGGGGSFVASNGTTVESSIIDGPGDGSVTICAILTSRSSAPMLSPWGLGLLTLVLTGLGLGLTARKL